MCVSSTSLSLSINGNLHGYFKGKRGLRQGDPMSLYLFTLVMEVHTRILNYSASLASNFRFHPKCEKQNIINLCFADDLFIFSHGDTRSAKIILDSINAFKDMSGLVPSMPKSNVFFCNVSDQIKQTILEIMPFEEGSLPVRYLGVPLISTQLLYKDCNVLLERMEKRITDWRNKSLSFARRLQLVRKVLSSLHFYWVLVFILQQRLVHDLECKMRRFLWSQGDLVKGKAKVAWKLLCVPQYEGGLGIRRISDFNKALMTKHVWSLLNRRESLWVKWIYSYRLKERNFWDIPIQQNCSCGWRKILQRRNHIWTLIGDGQSSSLWFEKWAEICPINNYVSPREINRAGFTLGSKVADLVDDGIWKWHVAWLDLFHVLISLPSIHPRPNVFDSLIWKDSDGIDRVFSLNVVWDTLRFRQETVAWHKVVWSQVRHLAQMHQISGKWEDICCWLLPRANSNSAKSVIGKLLVVATAYFIWQEWNRRLFSNDIRKIEQIRDIVAANVRLKLVTLRFKNSSQVGRFVEAWNLPRELVIYDT
uniref:uncharacterized protein LOC122587778 n=1 Tax=Erigeron canadensis TaxID=72917 RepID=UPI001CB965B6|nr:uncharacterized protein LOC122587778 [Erigeron canadensis]